MGLLALPRQIWDVKRDLLRGEGGYDTLVGAAGIDDCDVGPGGGVAFTCDGSAYAVGQPESSTTIVPWHRITGHGLGAWGAPTGPACLTAAASCHRPFRGTSVRVL